MLSVDQFQIDFTMGPYMIFTLEFPAVIQKILYPYLRTL